MSAFPIGLAAHSMNRRRLRGLRAACLAAVTVVTAGAASAQVLLGSDYHSLYAVDQSDASRSAAGPITAAFLNDLASDPGSGTLWGVTQSVSLDGAPKTSTLLTIDAASGHATGFVVLQAPATFDLGAQPLTTLAWDPVTHGLFGTTYDGFGGGALWKIDAATGALTLVDRLRLGRATIISGLAFDNNGLLYAISETQAQVALSRVDTVTAAVTDIGLTGVGYLGESGVEDIAFRPGDNTLFVSSNGLYTLDAATGASTAVGPGAGLSGLAFVGAVAPVPEPSTWAFTLAGLGLLGEAQRRRTRVSRPFDG